LFDITIFILKYRIISTIKTYTDEQLVSTLLLSKDEKTINELYNRYYPKVFQKCMSFCKSSDEDEAEDLAQEIFIKVLDKLHTFKRESKFSTWLYSVTYNHLVNYLKKDEKKLVERWGNLNSKNYQSLQEEDNEDYEFLELKTTKLKKAFELVEPEDKALLLMKYRDNIQISDMLKTFNIKESALKMRLKRAKSKIYKIYKTLN
jgi:RNA polymerase sigma-70 factor (ECF subfamily)